MLEVNEDVESPDPWRSCFAPFDDPLTPGLPSLLPAGEFGKEAASLVTTLVSAMEAGAMGTGLALEGEFFPRRRLASILLTENFRLGGGTLVAMSEVIIEWKLE